MAGTLDNEGGPCAILAIPRGCCLSIQEVSIKNEHRENPQAFLEVPELCSTIIKIPAYPVTALHDFHKQLVVAKSKAQVIDILCKRASQHGWLADMPDGLYDKLQGLRSSPLKQ